MAGPITLQEILKGAIQKEIDACTLYHTLREEVKDPTAKNAFLELAKQEMGHQSLLAKHLKGELKEGALSHGEHVDYHIAEHLTQPEVSLDMPLKDVFLLAAERGKASHDFYLAFAGIHPEGKMKKLFQELADQEMGHK